MPAAAATDCIGEVTIGERGRGEEEREEGEEGGEEGRGREKGTSAVAGGTGEMVPSGGAM